MLYSKLQENQVNIANDGTVVHSSSACIHCGEKIGFGGVIASGQAFCCSGCKTVYEILAEHDLCDYYARDENAGISMKRRSVREDEFAVLDDGAIARKLLTFSSPSLNRVVWTVPTIHCASCVWLIERFDRLEHGVLSSTVDLMRKTVTVDFDPRITSLRKIAERMASIGYTPLLRLEGETQTEHGPTRALYARLGIAGFAAGNTMMMYIAGYFAGTAGVERSLMGVFRLLSIVLSVPVVLYCAYPWFAGARAALRGRKINLDVPVALGIAVLFARSVFDIASGHGEGYLDSFNGLVFFLLIGRLFQQKAFDALSFDRTYRSFFPLSVRVEKGNSYQVIPIEAVKIGDILSVRNGEVIPCDSILESEAGYVDYSFVTGESVPVECTKSEMVYAGGKVMGPAIRLLAAKNVSHSELAAMWDRSSSEDATTKSKRATQFLKLSDNLGKWFTPIAILISVAGALLWLPDWAKAFNTFTAVLIIACPCALTLAAPITLGSAMGRLGRLGIYLKNMGVLLDLDKVDRVIFDKTGTLTTSHHELTFHGRTLTNEEWTAVQTIAAQSTHPVSRAIAREHQSDLAQVNAVREAVGHGIIGTAMGHTIALGSPEFVILHSNFSPQEVSWDGNEHRAASVAIDGEYAGAFTLQATVRPGIPVMIAQVKERMPIALISGDSERDRALLEPIFGENAMAFGCRPEKKIEMVESQRASGYSVLMVGDGLNDAGAMGEADVAIAVTDDTATLVPACDIIMRAESLPMLPGLLRYARSMKIVIVGSLTFSILYNLIGLTLAIMGKLSPMVAAILMPISSLTVIAMSAGGARKLIGMTDHPGRVK